MTAKIKKSGSLYSALLYLRFNRMNTDDNNDVKEAFAVLKKAIQTDASYAYSWHANIAMALYDELPETFWMPDKSHWHKITNQAAKHFMKRAFDVETSHDMLEHEFKAKK